MTESLFALCFWSLMCAAAFILGFGAGNAIGYGQGVRDAIEDAELDWPESYGGTSGD